MTQDNTDAKQTRGAVDESVCSEIRERAGGGETFTSIADDLGVSPPSISYHAKGDCSHDVGSALSDPRQDEEDLLTCPGCGRSFKRLGMHWRHSPEHRPKISEELYDITVGLLMGDGYIRRKKATPSIQCAMIAENYLEYLDSKFGILGTGVRVRNTAEEQAEYAKEAGFNPKATADRCHDIYQWYSRSHPDLEEFSEWYSTGEKQYPEDIELTPTVLRHWFVCDGSYNTSPHNNNISITTSKESDRTDNIDQMFERAGLPAPNNWHTRQQQNYSRNLSTATWDVDQTEELFEYMEHSLPDFGYKFPEWVDGPDIDCDGPQKTLTYRIQ